MPHNSSKLSFNSAKTLVAPTNNKTLDTMVATRPEAGLRAAANNGVSRDEIKEVLLQSAIYCGVPAANSAFHMAQEVFETMDADPCGAISSVCCSTVSPTVACCF